MSASRLCAPVGASVGLLFLSALAACGGAPQRPPPQPAASQPPAVVPAITHALPDAPEAQASRPTALPGTRPANLDAVPDAVPRVEPRSTLGNPPFYDVAGQRYFVLASAEGYKERGVASWYGPNFHEKNASNGDAYDMYAMTAAHKTLPLPSYVRVTNLANGRSVVVRVNDRGPFVGPRLIDLSYTAAYKLDMLKAGTAFVEVEALVPGTLSSAAAGVAPAVPTRLAATAAIFVQAGAFGVEDNARRLVDRLRQAGIESAAVQGPSGPNRIWRVRIGPLPDVTAYDRTISKLQSLGVEGRLAGE